MSEEQVVRHCAPTLAGLKTGSMFGAWYPQRPRPAGGPAGVEPAAGREGRVLLAPCGMKTAGR